MSVVSVGVTAISAAGWTAITHPRGQMNGDCVLHARDNTSFLVSDTSSGTNYLTVPASTMLTLNWRADGTSAGHPVVCYVKGTSTTSLELLANG